jgi:hypothetical protein
MAIKKKKDKQWNKVKNITEISMPKIWGLQKSNNVDKSLKWLNKKLKSCYANFQSHVDNGHNKIFF